MTESEAARLRRLQGQQIRRLKEVCDWSRPFPKLCNRRDLELLMIPAFFSEPTSVVLVGPSGVGKTTLARKIAHQLCAVDRRTVMFTTASQLFDDLECIDGADLLYDRLRHYARPDFLVIDDVGFSCSSDRDADVLFRLVGMRHHRKSTMITSNRSLLNWHEIFSDGPSVVNLIVRLLRTAKVLEIGGPSPQTLAET